jgi:hypothetical protein
MNDKAAIWMGLGILALGIIVFFTPVGYKLQLEVAPLAMGGMMVVALGLLLLIVGVVSFLAEETQE